MEERKNVHRDSSEQKVRKGTILYVEDNLLDIIIVTSVLVKVGYRVVVAQNGVQGISKAKEINPDLILMDYNLPVMNGRETAAEMRSIRQFDKIPIIAHTTDRQLDDDDGIFVSSCEGYIPKPMDFKRFVEKIEQHLILKRSADA